MPVTQFKDPRVTPRTVLESWGDFRKELMNEIRLMQGRNGLTTVMKAPFFPRVTNFSATGRAALARETVVRTRSWRISEPTRLANMLSRC